MKKINKVVLLGGTHGNELSGIFLAEKWLKNKKELQTALPSCPISVHITNPEAVSLCRRYKDFDLNRQFFEDNYIKVKTSPENLPYEVLRAKELHDLITGAPEVEKPQFLLDLHNTTANVGCMLIVSNPNDNLSLQAAAYIQSKLKATSCICEIVVLGYKAYGNTRSLSAFGLGIEVGPQPHGVLRSDVLQLQEQAVIYALDFINKFNEGEKYPSIQITAFKILQNVCFPPDYSPRTAVIHEKLQDKDYQPLLLSDPVFRTVDDKVICLNDLLKAEDQPSVEIYPIFVNEAAYYEKDLAFWLTTKEKIILPSLPELNVNC